MNDYKCVGSFRAWESVEHPEIEECQKKGHLFRTEKTGRNGYKYICDKCKIYYYKDEKVF